VIYQTRPGEEIHFPCSFLYYFYQDEFSNIFLESGHIMEELNMELRQLKYFIAVAEELHFGHAAQKLNMTQHPLSKQIQLLESELGVPLFKRNHRKVELTYAGKTLLTHAHHIVEAVERSIEAVNRAYRCENNILEIGYTGMVDLNLIPFVIQQLRNHHPQVELIFREIPSARQIIDLDIQKIDIGILHSFDPNGRLSKLPLYNEKFVIACSRRHPLACQEKIFIQDLKQVELIFPESADFKASILRHLRNHGVNPVLSQQKASDYTCALSLVAANLGITMVPEFLCDTRRHDVVFRQTVEPLTLEVSVAYRRDDPSDLIEIFLSAIGPFRAIRTLNGGF
jgi:DNA-binding transcriptional LysR family regulator